MLNDGLTDNISEIQEAMVSARKYTDQMDQRLDQILSQEERKDRLLGPNKQKLTKLQIHRFLVEDGYDIGYSTIAVKTSEKLSKNKECFIRQLYDLGDRLEYDFGEIKL